MLHACLSRLELAATEDVSLVVSLDRGSDPGCRSVAETFSRRFPSIYLREMYEHPFRGNSCNVISGIKDCLKMGGDLLHVVEEDVLVARGYFEFHEAMHEVAPTAFAVSACRNQNQIRTVDQAAYLHPSYQSLGVSMRAEIAERVIIHDTPLYYGNMVGYCSKVFTSSIIPSGHAEQDGLINRVRELACGRTVYTNRPRAFHAGFHGYNRPGTRLAGGTVVERAARILAMTSQEMNALAGELKDHEVIDLEECLSVEPERDALSAALRV
jgi:hypothetical protein